MKKSNESVGKYRPKVTKVIHFNPHKIEKL